LVLTGSPRKEGTSALLADEFIAGAKEKGHAVVRFDTAFEQVNPCTACYYCDLHDGQCIQKDSMEKILPEVFSADMIVLVTPIYYFNMSAQLKVVIDRFRARRDDLRKHPMKSVMMATCGSDFEWAMDAVNAHYQCLLKYLPWENQGALFARKVYARKDIEGTEHPVKAKELGLSL
jgi:multimeric flavodoxin WrbA